MLDETRHSPTLSLIKRDSKRFLVIIKINQDKIKGDKIFGLLCISKHGAKRKFLGEKKANVALSFQKLFVAFFLFDFFFEI